MSGPPQVLRRPAMSAHNRPPLWEAAPGPLGGPSQRSSVLLCRVSLLLVSFWSFWGGFTADAVLHLLSCGLLGCSSPCSPSPASHTQRSFRSCSVASAELLCGGPIGPLRSPSGHWVHERDPTRVTPEGHPRSGPVGEPSLDRKQALQTLSAMSEFAVENVRGHGA